MAATNISVMKNFYGDRFFDNSDDPLGLPSSEFIFWRQHCDSKLVVTTSLDHQVLLVPHPGGNLFAFRLVCKFTCYSSPVLCKTLYSSRVTSSQFRLFAEKLLWEPSYVAV